MTDADQDQEAADALDELAQQDLDIIDEDEEFQNHDEMRGELQERDTLENSRITYITLLIVAIFIILSVLPVDRLAPKVIQHFFYANTIVKSAIMAVCVVMVLKLSV